MPDLIYINRHGNGNIGRFSWCNSDTRCVASSRPFWGDWWWSTAGERQPLPTITTEDTDHGNA